MVGLIRWEVIYFDSRGKSGRLSAPTTQQSTVSPYEERNKHIDEKSCTCLRTTDNITCHPITDATSKLHPLDAFIISTGLEPERMVFTPQVSDPYAQFAWTTAFGTMIVQEMPS
ncbi:hypothetical protein V6N11_056058 [Hibiscus sabdariffa]|uniref:Uncharacterized protein n=1 Tax=Hibiscus sabdariffa TaxID=183260 RepID=A0ABR2T2Y4_9ROSI